LFSHELSINGKNCNFMSHDTVPDTVLLAQTPMNIVNVTGGTGLLPIGVYSPPTPAQS
jgi:hypothetical protein